MGPKYDSPDEDVIRAAEELWKPNYQRVKLYLAGTVSESQPNMAEVDFTQAEPTVRRWSSYETDADANAVPSKGPALEPHKHVGSVGVDRGETCLSCGRDMHDPIHTMPKRGAAQSDGSAATEGWMKP